MTKQELAQQILQAVDNSRSLDGANDARVVQEAIIPLLETLQPVDRERFAVWGHPNQRCTPTECW